MEDVNNVTKDENKEILDSDVDQGKKNKKKKKPKKKKIVNKKSPETDGVSKHSNTVIDDTITNSIIENKSVTHTDSKVSKNDENNSLVKFTPMDSKIVPAIYPDYENNESIAKEMTSDHPGAGKADSDRITDTDAENVDEVKHSETNIEHQYYKDPEDCFDLPYYNKLVLVII